MSLQRMMNITGHFIYTPAIAGVGERTGKHDHVRKSQIILNA